MGKSLSSPERICIIEGARVVAGHTQMSWYFVKGDLGLCVLTVCLLNL